MEVSRYWRNREERYGLTGSTCSKCGKTYMAARPVCSVCQMPVNDIYEFEHRTIHQQSLTSEAAQR